MIIKLSVNPAFQKQVKSDIITVFGNSIPVAHRDHEKNGKGDIGMLSEVLNDLYGKLRLYFYMRTAKNFENREATLTTVETFCMEVINALGNPTVSEFADIMGFSGPNAASKISSLVRKGYVEKVQSESDRRTYHLHPTKKFYEYYKISLRYIEKVQKRCEKRFTPEELKNLEDLLKIIDDELMPEVDVTLLKKKSDELEKVREKSSEKDEAPVLGSDGNSENQ
jgi:DNA-binding MarR family transcriptional regulator